MATLSNIGIVSTLALVIFYVAGRHHALAAPTLLQCATLELKICGNFSDDDKECKTATKVISLPQRNNDSENVNEFTFTNVTRVLSVSTSDKCHLTLCDDSELMGYCGYFNPGKAVALAQFQNIFMSNMITALCTCKNDFRENAIAAAQFRDDEHFDRNYIGVVFSPYDKLWEAYQNGTKYRIPWSNYTLNEIRSELETVSTKFSFISTFGMGTVSNNSEWSEGDKIAFTGQLAAEINAQVGYPILRVSIGVYRKDDVNMKWNSKELYNALDAAKVANALYNGTVWGVTLTSQYVKETSQAREALDMIKEVRAINKRDRLLLKIGIRLDGCLELVSYGRPEDDESSGVIYGAEWSFKPETVFQRSLHEIVARVDYLLCVIKPSPELVRERMEKILEVMQGRYRKLRDKLRRLNPKLRLVIETGVASQGVGDGFHNTLRNFREFWYSMAKFAQKEHIHFHMLEATDQPWKVKDDAAEDRYDINGRNGTDSHYGWWRRLNNSKPPVYIEKIQETDLLASGENGDSAGGASWTTKILLICFFAFVGLTMAVTGSLWWKLRKARRTVISQAYIQQFHRGGDDCHGVDDTNYAVALRIPYDKKQYELQRDSFVIDKSAKLGSGQSGVVYRGVIGESGRLAAFKCTSASTSVPGIKSVMSEIKILSYLGSHENLVRIVGAYTKKIDKGIVYVALEYCPLGDLETYLRNLDMSSMARSSSSFDGVVNQGYVTTVPEELGPGYVCPTQLQFGDENESGDESSIETRESIPDIGMDTLIHWAYQIASAMEFVSSKKVIHADLATRNVLLSAVNHVKISDFGLSRKLYQEMGGVVHDEDTPLPWRWMSPESLRHMVFSVESDVWAFGVTAWEIFSLAEVPYHGTSYDMQFAEMLHKGKRLPRAKLANDAIDAVLNKCWNWSPADRPTFTELKDFLGTCPKWL